MNADNNRGHHRLFLQVEVPVTTCCDRALDTSIQCGGSTDIQPQLLTKSVTCASTRHSSHMRTAFRQLLHVATVNNVWPSFSSNFDTVNDSELSNFIMGDDMGSRNGTPRIEMMILKVLHTHKRRRVNIRIYEVKISVDIVGLLISGISTIEK